ncbi:MAG: hypothetical protein O2887_17130 [Bacteroidetes bacterium]|nr:hypothetical protein [Bacteroidota bacterium]MDA1122184.1 hypothetical protein [Bacteroidota bacterium]
MNFPLLAQEFILQKEPVNSKFLECFYHIYNSDTASFKESSIKLKKLIPTHPANDLLIALSIYWSKYPLNLDGKELVRMKEELIATTEKCHEILENHENDFEVRYVDMIAHSILALTYSRDSQFFKAAGEAKKAYNYFRDGFELMKNYNEFYFSSGLYSYYREKYPEAYPIYRAVVWMFKSGDKKEGLRLMALAFKETVFAKAEAAHYLSHILMRYEMKPALSLRYVEYLSNRYPGNLFFKANYIENLLFLKRYDDAALLLDDFPDDEHAFYQMAKKVFTGIVAENESEYKFAERCFNDAIEISKRGTSEEINNLKSLSYCGLARLSLLVGNMESTLSFYKMANDLVKYDLYKKEPEEYLSRHDTDFKN